MIFLQVQLKTHNLNFCVGHVIIKHNQDTRRHTTRHDVRGDKNNTSRHPPSSFGKQRIFIACATRHPRCWTRYVGMVITSVKQKAKKHTHPLSHKKTKERDVEIDLDVILTDEEDEEHKGDGSDYHSKRIGQQNSQTMEMVVRDPPKRPRSKTSKHTTQNMRHDVNLQITNEKSISDDLEEFEKDQSDESDAIDTLTHLCDDKPNKSPHIGKGLLKVSCRSCDGPIAVKVSNDLRKHNKTQDDKSKICQKCFNELLLKDKKRAQSLRKIVEMHVANENSFPWNIRNGQYTCADNFTGKYDFKKGDQFQISYNYDESDLTNYISISICVSSVNQKTFNVTARSPEREFQIMEKSLERKGYPDAVHHPEKSIYEWNWTNIPKIVLFHCKMISNIQEVTGNIESCHMMFVDSKENITHAFSTSDEVYHVQYPFHNYFDFDIEFPEKFYLEIQNPDGKRKSNDYTHVILDRKSLEKQGNFFGLDIVADDISTNSIYMTMKYVSFRQLSTADAGDDILIQSVLNRIILKAKYSDLVQFPFFIDELRKLSFTGCGFGTNTEQFKVKGHLKRMFSKITS